MVKEQEITTLLAGYSARFREPMAPYTTLKIGGPADALVFPKTFDEVMALMRRLTESSVPFMVLGNGSNLLISDAGIAGVVIHLRDLDQVILKKDALFYVEAGLAFPKLSVFAQKQGLTGLEFAAGIPGTVGGAIAMNAGIPGEETGSVVKNVYLVTDAGELQTIPQEACAFSYRATGLPPGIIVAADIVLRHGDLNAIEEKRVALIKKRRATQPLSSPNVGSIFKNPGSLLMPSAGHLIEAVQLKGHRIGGAQISEKHANFIINLGNAMAQDVLALIELIQERVFVEKGIRLEPEIKIVRRSDGEGNNGERP